MATYFDWVKLVVDNKLLLALLLAGIGSLGTNIGQLFESYEQEAEIKATHKQIAEIANHYAAPKTVTVKSNCDKCMYEVRKLRKEYH